MHKLGGFRGCPGGQMATAEALKEASGVLPQRACGRPSRPWRPAAKSSAQPTRRATKGVPKGALPVVASRLARPARSALRERSAETKNRPRTAFGAGSLASWRNRRLKPETGSLAPSRTREQRGAAREAGQAEAAFSRVPLVPPTSQRRRSNGQVRRGWQGGAAEPGALWSETATGRPDDPGPARDAPMGAPRRLRCPVPARPLGLPSPREIGLDSPGSRR
jgi:hypothetical protein